MHNARRKAAVQFGVPAADHRADAEGNDEGDDAGEGWHPAQAIGRPPALWPPMMGNLVAASVSAEAPSPAGSGDSAGAGAGTNWGGSIVREPFEHKPRSLPSRMCSGNWHGAPNPGANP
jgi:hypothetical protein